MKFFLVELSWEEGSNEMGYPLFSESAMIAQVKFLFLQGPSPPNGVGARLVCKGSLFLGTLGGSCSWVDLAAGRDCASLHGAPTDGSKGQRAWHPFGKLSHPTPPEPAS